MNDEEKVRLRAIEHAAREYRAAYELCWNQKPSDVPANGGNTTTSQVADKRRALFNLLGAS